jgi:hypothetical protein
MAMLNNQMVMIGGTKLFNVFEDLESNKSQ